MALQVDGDSDTFSIINNEAISLEFNDLAIQEDMMSQQGQLEVKIRSLIDDREKMASRIIATEEQIFGLEKSLLDTKHELLNIAGDDIFCQSCSQIEDSRCRKKLLLHLIYGEVLFEKPKQLLCIFGLFKRFEEMIFLGFMDESSLNPFNDNEARCHKCNHIIDCKAAKKFLLYTLLEEMKTNKNSMIKKVNSDECSAETCCNKCHSFTKMSLASALGNLESGIEQPSIATAYKPRDARRKEIEVPQSLLTISATPSVSYKKNPEPEMKLNLQPLSTAVRDDAVDGNLKQDDEKFTVQTKFVEKIIESDGIAKLQEEINNLKLIISGLDIKLNEQNIELRQRIRQTLNDKKEVQVGDKSYNLSQYYALGTQITVSKFTAAPEEDPYVLLQKWEHELNQCGVPRADWTWIVTRALEGTAKGWWATHGYCDEVPWDEFRSMFLASFGRAELRRWLTYAGHLCLAAYDEPVGPYITRRYQLVLRAVGQNPKAALALVERHLNARLGKYLILKTFEDLYFVIVAEQVLDFNSAKLLFAKVLTEIRDDERYWKDKMM